MCCQRYLNETKQNKQFPCSMRKYYLTIYKTRIDNKMFFYYFCVAATYWIENVGFRTVIVTFTFRTVYSAILHLKTGHQPFDMFVRVFKIHVTSDTDMSVREGPNKWCWYHVDRTVWNLWRHRRPNLNSQIDRIETMQCFSMLRQNKKREYYEIIFFCLLANTYSENWVFNVKNVDLK